MQRAVSSQIFYNGSFTYVKDGADAMKLRDMINPEGVVVKTATGYAYRYFMRDYLNSVRHVSGIEQLTDYDPLGAVISSLNLDKNAYLYESKELYTDFSSAYMGVYDFGARFYNPFYGRWFAPDPAKQGINPYTYCGNNPVMFVDPDGKKIKLTGPLDLQQLYVEQLQATVGGRRFLELTLDYNGNIGYNPGRKFESGETANYNMIASIIDDDIITVNIELKEIEIFNESSTIGGSFMGNTYDAETGKVNAKQIVDPVFMKAFDMTTGNYGAGALHELTEAFVGAGIALELRESIGDSRQDKEIYEKAHEKATPIPSVEHWLFDVNGKITRNPVEAKRIEFYWRKQGEYMTIMRANFQKR